MEKFLKVAEQGFVILSIVIYSSGPLPLFLSRGAGQGILEVSPDPTDYSSIQTLFFLNYLIALFLLILRWKKTLYFLTKDWTIWLLMAIALASFFWSAIPKLTQVRSIALVGTSIFGFYLASRYTVREQLRLLGWSFAAILGMSFLLAIIIPSYGIMSSGIHSGAWRGIYVHKNTLGKTMVLSGIIFLSLAMDSKRYKWLSWVGFGATVALLVLSKSSASAINFVTILLLIPVYSTFRWRYDLMVPAAIAITILGGGLSLWFSGNAASLLESIGKDPTLTGRTLMFPYMLDMIEKQPWLGYGYNGFWNDWDSPGAYVWWAVKWSPPTAHNGFIDLLLELGLLGVAVFAIGMGQAVVRTLHWFRMNRSLESFWILLYFTYLVLANLGESVLLNRNDISWLLYATIVFSLAIAESQQSTTVEKY